MVLPNQAKKRKRLNAFQQREIKSRYPGARTRAQKEKLAEDIGLTLTQLHGAAYRLGVSHPARGPGAAARRPRPEHKAAHNDDTFSPTDARYLESEFERLPIEQIAAFLGRSEAEAAYQARLLGLRKPVRYWDAEKAARWLGLSLSALRNLKKQGVEVYALRGRLGRKIELVETLPLARWLNSPLGEKLLATTDHDIWFVREVVESVQAVAAGETTFAPRWLSHGHTCLNPIAAGFGRFCLGSPGHEAGDDPKCPALNLTVPEVKQMSVSLRA